MIYRTILVCTFCCIVAATGVAQTGQNDRGVATLSEYFDLLVSGNIESAGSIWTEAMQERAARFGIEYTDAPLKIDCNSPVVRNLSVMRDYLQPPAKHVISLPGGDFAKLDYSTVVGSSKVQHYYYVQKIGDYYWLTCPQDYYGRDWPTVESKYFRVRVHPNVKGYLNPCLLDEADKFVVAIGDSLELSRSDMELLEKQKVEYYYCDKDSTVQKITGHMIKGTLDLPTNDLISATFPHFHELIHLMVNIKLKKTPLMTLPLLREGIAVRYGGRWGKSPSSLVDLGIFLYKEKLVELDSILTLTGFTMSAGADIAYPVAGVFTYYMLDQLGTKKFFEVYREFSGTFNELNEMTIDDIKAHLARVMNKPDWDALVADFDSYLERRPPETLAALPGVSNKAKEILHGDIYNITEDKHWLSFDFVVPAADSVIGTLLWGRNDELAGGASSLFDDHFGALTDFEGYRFAVRFDQYEAGMYDYATNQLMAKYIWGITPSDDYYDADSRTVRVRFRKSLLMKNLPKENDMSFIKR